MVDEEVVIM
ncbi:Protein of unknown function [Bacillus wiedmannii]|uniref:Uncharacterized protein n=1 Tax=Bacillus wiedmannii TaxID=1890302 RepID=A0AB37YTQ0_9BACI|nr:Protein of unknown function [Bacillus wiedmannii]